MKPLLYFLSLFLSFFANGQTDVLTDSRDGQQYKTIVIGDKIWFRENLRYQTAKSFCPNYNKDSIDCKDGNYYSNSELNTICPDGWHVATIAEWEDYIRIILKNKAINGGVFKYDSSIHLGNHFAINMIGAEFFKDTILNLIPTGWVEGLRLKKNGTLSLWVVDTQTQDSKYHVHVGNDGFVKHTHKHNIIDKPQKVRKFPVRCVCELLK